MQTQTEKKYLNTAWLIIALGFILRCIYAQAFLLVPDETNYWQWSRHLAWGYHDQAPLIGWSIYISTYLLGHTELAVRMPSIIAITVTSVYLILAAKRWCNLKVGLHALLIAQTIFLFNIGGLLGTADGLQGAAWAGASYHAARAFEDNRWQQWMLGGLWFGLGMLSKYTMVLFLPCLLLYALFAPLHRRRMLQIKPYIACLIGLGLFSPVIFWNANNSWNSLRHVAYIGGASEPFGIHLKYLGDLLASQAALLSPLIFVLIIAGWYRAWHIKVHQDAWILRFIFFTSFPVIAGFALLSLHSRVYGNWPGAGYVFTPILIAALWGWPSKKVIDNSRNKLRRLWLWTLSTSLCLTLALLTHVIWPILPIPAALDRSVEETVGWDQLGQQVGRIKQSMLKNGPVFIFGVKYQIASELAFYTPGQPMTVSINRWDRPNVYDYWWQDQDLLGSNAVGVLQDKNSRKRLLAVFNNVAPPEPLVIYRPNLWERFKPQKDIKPVKTYYIYRCYGFKGGLHWIPASKSDIRSK